MLPMQVQELLEHLHSMLAKSVVVIHGVALFAFIVNRDEAGHLVSTIVVDTKRVIMFAAA